MWKERGSLIVYCLKGNSISEIEESTMCGSELLGGEGKSLFKCNMKEETELHVLRTNVTLKKKTKSVQKIQVKEDQRGD